MKILVYGAGVLDGLYAAQRQVAGQDVTLLARGQRRADLQQHGVLENVVSGQRSTTRHERDRLLHTSAVHRVRSVEFFTAHSRNPHKRKVSAQAAAFLRPTPVELAVTVDRDKVCVSAGQASGSMPG